MKKEGVPETYLDEDEARVAATAEQPVRDLAREAGVDALTKEVFDKRAEKRGEEALEAYKAKKESLAGLVNPELREIKERLAEINAQLEAEFGEQVEEGHTVFPHLLRYHHNENGELDSISINNLLWFKRDKDKYFSVGPLGKKLESDAVANLNNQTENRDQYIIDAYKHDPELRALIDRFIQLHKELEDQVEKKEEIRKRKAEQYRTAEGINLFLERIGHSKKFPEDFNPSEAYSAFLKAEEEKDVATMDRIGSQLRWAFGTFDGLSITKEQKADFGVDLNILQNQLGEIAAVLKSARDWNYPRESKERFVKQLGASTTGKRFLSQDGEKPFLYSIKES